MCYVDGYAVKPQSFKIDDKTGKLVKPNGSLALEDKIEDCDMKINEYCQKNAYVYQTAHFHYNYRLTLIASPETGQWCKCLERDLQHL